MTVVPTRILLVEDDLELASMVADFLRSHHVHAEIESNGDQAIQVIREGRFDALILDIGLPGTDGLSICRQVRGEFDGPILMLTARGDEVDEVTAFEVGADDYMAKPVRPNALLMRIQMHLRRGDAGPRQTVGQLAVDDLLIHASDRSVFLGGREIDLTTAEFELLWTLASKAGQVVERRDIYQELLGIPYDGMDRSIDLRVSRLRRKLGDDPQSPQRIKSVRGVGYLLATNPSTTKHS